MIEKNNKEIKDFNINFNQKNILIAFAIPNYVRLSNISREYKLKDAFSPSFVSRAETKYYKNYTSCSNNKMIREK